MELESLKPAIAVIDSIQALYYGALTSAPGSVSQVRECTSALMQVAKRDDISLFIVGHVTKEGAIAGPKVLEHLVDTVLYFEGDRFASHRLLRSVKNRFGATHELGIFEMVDRGLQEVHNPSELFLGNRDEAVPGIATIVACEGTRPLVVELQALVSPTSYSSPRRSTTGIEFNRLLQILAVLEKRVGIPLSKLDAYVASSGGLECGGTGGGFGDRAGRSRQLSRSRDRSLHRDFGRSGPGGPGAPRLPARTAPERSDQTRLQTGDRPQRPGRGRNADGSGAGRSGHGRDRPRPRGQLIAALERALPMSVSRSTSASSTLLNDLLWFCRLRLQQVSQFLQRRIIAPDFQGLRQ